ncbi:uncharacterized protein LOC126904877 [Daktulosphaira vitifoliae]|uniref:uncharacterized protein LOC126904877 n=1 Tax=Daktulosphaira vitifoliae TaxID=58002 RepID=UPI0021A9B2A5|nr:uncharacterized protein LOC126904877 [Daktulosphaira vitifoliae]XP_050540173.1 uncharacterized protein LOC126904877 [Daktulosphaira vitifoliae]XP_050540174.1 uncharacterized protein LOC126904877 [Daktulosphaira vitifoliae]
MYIYTLIFITVLIIPFTIPSETCKKNSTVINSTRTLPVEEKMLAYRSMADEYYRMQALIDVIRYNRQKSASLMEEYKEQLERAKGRAQKCAFALERGQRDVAKWTERAKTAHFHLRDKHQAMEEAEIIESCMSSLILSTNLNTFNKDNELRLKESSKKMIEQGIVGFLKNYTSDLAK